MASTGWTLGDIVTAVAGADLRIIELVEHAYGPLEGRRWPEIFTLVAVRAA